MHPFDELTTQDLLVRAESGSSGAWTELYDRHREYLLESVRRRVHRLHGLSFEEEDVLQSAFFSAFKHLDGFEYRGEGSFLRWLGRIVTNNTLQKLRKQTSESKNLPSRRRRNILEILDENTRPPSEVVSNAENEERLMRFIEALPKGLREVVALRDFEQLTWDEVAVRTSAANSTVRLRYREAWTRLTRRMNGNNGSGAAPESG